MKFHEIAGHVPLIMLGNFFFLATNNII